MVARVDEGGLECGTFVGVTLVGEGVEEGGRYMEGHFVGPVGDKGGWADDYAGEEEGGVGVRGSLSLVEGWEGAMLATYFYMVLKV